MFIVQSMPSFAFHIPVEELDILHVEELQSSYTDYSYAVFFFFCKTQVFMKTISDEVCLEWEWEATLILIKDIMKGCFAIVQTYSGHVLVGPSPINYADINAINASIVPTVVQPIHNLYETKPDTAFHTHKNTQTL